MNGVPFNSLAKLSSYKTRRGQAKDVADLVLIRNYLDRQLSFKSLITIFFALIVSWPLKIAALMRCESPLPFPANASPFGCMKTSTLLTYGSSCGWPAYALIALILTDVGPSQN